MNRIFCALLILLLTAGSAAAVTDSRSIREAKIPVRQAPEAKAAVLYTAARYYPLEVVGKRGEWLRVRDFEGELGWVPAPALGTEPGCVVREPVANVRTGPGDAHRILFKAERGAAFRVVGREGEWIKVLHDSGRGGFIHRSKLWGDLSPRKRD